MLRSRGTWVGIASLGAAMAMIGCGGDDGNGTPNGSGGTNTGTGGTNTGTGGTNTGTGGGNMGTGGATGGNGQSGFQPQTVPGTDGYDCSEPADAEIPALQLTEVESGFTAPVLVVHPPNDDRLFVVEQDGAIQVVQGGNTVGTFLDIPDLVISPADVPEEPWTRAEQGLLGLAFHPNYSENGLFYVHYNADGGSTGYQDGDTVIAEYQVSSDANVADATSERIVLHVEQEATNHNGGTITFGSDGYLYIALGDGGGGNDTYGNGQNEQTLLGTILRIDPTGQSDGDYSVPSGNLQEVLPSAAPEIWDYGLRNPYRVNFDGCTGVLYIGDVGQDAFEEVDIENPGDGQRNYGWPIMEGDECLMPPSGCDQSGLTLPFITYPHPEDVVAVTGGTVYRGSAIPSLRGTYVYADHSTNWFWTAKYDPTTQTITDPVERTSDLDPAMTGPSISSIQNGADGEIYMTSRTQGILYRLEAE